MKAGWQGDIGALQWSFPGSAARTFTWVGDAVLTARDAFIQVCHMTQVVSVNIPARKP